MPRHGQRTTEEASAAGSEALKGAVVGAAKVSSIRNSPLAFLLSRVCFRFDYH